MAPHLTPSVLAEISVNKEEFEITLKSWLTKQMLLRKERSLASARRTVFGDIVPTMFLLGVGGEELLKDGKESREKNEATNSGNCDAFTHRKSYSRHWITILKKLMVKTDREKNNEVFVSTKRLER